MKAIALMVICVMAGLTGTAMAVEFSTHLPGENPFERPSKPTFRPSITKQPGHYSTDDWQRAIDSVWGEGLPVETKLSVFDQFRDVIDAQFACFNNLDATRWDSLRVAYREEIEDTVSRGRFAAMMSHLAMSLDELHTFAVDTHVCSGTVLVPGTPVHVIGGWRYDDHFGAGLTPMPDSSLLVYDVAEPHPLDLQPGDVILGYDGRPWTQCYHELLDAQLPIRRRWWWGSSPSSKPHTLLISAGMNWHLFDTIDVKKRSSDSVVHLPTSLMVGHSIYEHFSEQMDIPGVPKPNIGAMEAVTYGVIDDTRIGYIFGWVWMWNAGQEFYEACSVLTSDTTLAGIIVDFRYNEGGYSSMSDDGLSILFGDTVETDCICIRADTVHRCSLVVSIPASEIAIEGRPPGYDRPIAVLLGPGCYSSGDHVAFRIKHHPMARTFGKPTCGAFIGGTSHIYPHADWSVRYATLERRVAADSSYYLTHRGFEPDTFVWHTREAVADGRDAVVEAAIAWIDSGGGVTEAPRTPATAGRSVQTIIRGVLRLPENLGPSVPRALFSISGRKVADLHPGENDIRHLAPGVYVVHSALSRRTAPVGQSDKRYPPVAKVIVTR